MDGKHVVFGEVIRGKSVVRAIENQPTSSGDAPDEPCVIAASGQLDPSDPVLSQSASSESGDPYEDYPDDQDPLIDGNIQEKPEVALRVAQEIREVGNKLFKEGKTSEALEKYQSERFATQIPSFTDCDFSEAVRYLDVHPVLPEDAPPELRDSYEALLAPLLLNSALAAVRSGAPQVAINSATRALDRLQLNHADKGKESSMHSRRVCYLMCIILIAKALYRRALGLSATNEDAEAEKDLVRAHELVKEDAAIVAELEKLRQRKKEKREKEKKAFKKLFV